MAPYRFKRNDHGICHTTMKFNSKGKGKGKGKVRKEKMFLRISSSNMHLSILSLLKIKDLV
jgi:hypothetical protein